MLISISKDSVRYPSKNSFAELQTPKDALNTPLIHAAMDDYEYVDEAAVHPELICPICSRPLRDAVEDSCLPLAHTFCHQCIHLWLSGKGTSTSSCSAPSSNRACPSSRAPLATTDLKPAGLARRLTNELPVYCSRRHSGCNWTGRRDNLKDHLDHSCQYQRLPCPGNNIGLGPAVPGCQVKLKRAELAKHAATCTFVQMTPVWQAISREMGILNAKVKKLQARVNVLEEVVEESPQYSDLTRKRMRLMGQSSSNSGSQGRELLDLDESGQVKKSIIHLHARLVGEEEVVLSFALAKTTRLAKLMDSFQTKVYEFSSSLAHLDIRNAEFWVGTHKIDRDETPEELDLVFGSEIVVKAPLLVK